MFSWNGVKCSTWDKIPLTSFHRCCWLLALLLASMMPTGGIFPVASAGWSTDTLRDDANLKNAVILEPAGGEGRFRRSGITETFGRTIKRKTDVDAAANSKVEKKPTEGFRIGQHNRPFLEKYAFSPHCLFSDGYRLKPSVNINSTFSHFEAFAAVFLLFSLTFLCSSDPLEHMLALIRFFSC